MTEYKHLIDEGMSYKHVTNTSQHGVQGSPSDCLVEESESQTDVQDQLPIIQHEKKRWYILAVFTFQTFTQALIWTMWGPIAASAEFAYNWDNSTIALLGNWGCVVAVMSLVPLTWTMNEKGMRIACLLTTACMLLGSVMKCLPVPASASVWLIHAGQIFNAVGIPVTMAGPPVISSLWFPVHQRTTATSIAFGLGGAGEATAFLLGPFIVPELAQNDSCLNKTAVDVMNISVICEEQQNHVRHKITLLMYIEGAMTAAVFLLVLIYFPSKPRFAPSITSSLSRTDLTRGLKEVIRNGRFWLLCAVYGALGALWGWYAVLDIILKPLGVTEKTAGWLGFACGIGPQLAAVPIGFFADVIAKKMKVTLIILYIIGTASFLVFALTCIKCIPFYIEILFVSGVCASMCLFSGNPLIYELLSECTYPVPEALTNNLLQATFNVVTFFLFLVFMFPGVGTSWVNWTVLATVAVSIPMLVLFKEDYRRFDVDTEDEEERDNSKTNRSRDKHIEQPQVL